MNFQRFKDLLKEKGLNAEDIEELASEICGGIDVEIISNRFAIKTELVEIEISNKGQLPLCSTFSVRGLAHEDNIMKLNIPTLDSSCSDAFYISSFMHPFKLSKLSCER